MRQASGGGKAVGRLLSRVHDVLACDLAPRISGGLQWGSMQQEREGSDKMFDHEAVGPEDGMPSSCSTDADAERAKDPFANMTEEELDSFFHFLERDAVEESPFSDD